MQTLEIPPSACEPSPMDDNLATNIAYNVDLWIDRVWESTDAVLRRYGLIPGKAQRRVA